MAEAGKYIYGIIGTNGVRNFGPIGVGGRGAMVSTINYQDISAVISNYPMDKYELSKENLIAHQRVIEQVMCDYTVLPTRAFTVAANAEEVRDFLRKRYRKLTSLLKDMDNKIEMGLIACWKDMASIFHEIVNENDEIKQLKERIAQTPEPQTLKDRISLGKMVADALAAKKESEGDDFLRPLQKTALDLCRNDVRSDEMIVNAAFLIDRAREKEFDNKVSELDLKYSQRIRFKYVGPVPPYNFVDFTI